MKPRFVADGASRLEQSEEFQARLRALRGRILEKYAAELSTAGLLRRCILRWRIAVEYRQEEKRILPSSQALYSSGINWQALTIQFRTTPALTPALSPEERENRRHPSQKQTRLWVEVQEMAMTEEILELSRNAPTMFPLPGGEGQGEGDALPSA
jgi:hypothetical protein